MPAISRQVGTTSEVLPVFIPDATVSTGAGLANIVASSVTLAWFRNDMAAVSTQTLTTATLGTWATSGFVQALSTLALGWYDVSLPDGVFASGRSAAVHLSGAPNMAPVPIIIELSHSADGPHPSLAIIDQGTAQAATASTVTLRSGASFGDDTLVGAVIAVYGAGQGYWQTREITDNISSTDLVTVDSFTVTPTSTLTYKIFANAPSSSTSPLPFVNVAQVLGSAVVTSAAGVIATTWDLGRTANLTSTIALTGTSIAYVTTAGNAAGASVNVSSIMGSPVVTTAAGVVATAWDLGRTANLTSTIALTGTSINYVTTAGAVTGLSPSLIDVSVSSRLASSSYTTPPTVAQITTGVLFTNLAESYRTNASTGTLAQVIYELLAHHGEAAINVTTKTIKRLDHSSTAATFTLDSSTAPTSITRAS